MIITVIGNIKFLFNYLLPENFKVSKQRVT